MASYVNSHCWTNFQNPGVKPELAKRVMLNDRLIYGDRYFCQALCNIGAALGQTEVKLCLACWVSVENR